MVLSENTCEEETGRVAVLMASARGDPHGVDGVPACGKDALIRVPVPQMYVIRCKYGPVVRIVL